MKTLLCVLLVAVAIPSFHLSDASAECAAVKNPAAARDLPTFYRTIQALIGDSMLNETAVATV